jgi:hypothetical protein
LIKGSGCGWIQQAHLFGVYSESYDLVKVWGKIRSPAFFIVEPANEHVMESVRSGKHGIGIVRVTKMMIVGAVEIIGIDAGAGKLREKRDSQKNKAF